MTEKTTRIFGYKVTYTHRDKADSFGRFGGGWNWIIGVQFGGRTMIINLLVCSIRITRPE